MKEKKEIIDKINNQKKVKIDDASVITNDKNKNGIIVILIIIILLLIALITYKASNKDVADNIKFKNEYEILNGKKSDNNRKISSIKVDEDNVIKYSNYEEIFELLENGTGVIYFGFPECPWCRNVVPVLIDSANEAGIDTIYYLNNKEDRNDLSLKDGNVITNKKGTENYDKLLDKLKDYTDIYEGLEDENIKRLYFPTVVIVKEGEIILYHSGTVDSQEDPYVLLNKDQKEELKNIFVDKMTKLFICDEKC